MLNAYMTALANGLHPEKQRPPHWSEVRKIVATLGVLLIAIAGVWIAHHF